MSPYDFACPRCKAHIGHHCHSGIYNTAPHSLRWKKAGVRTPPNYQQAVAAHADIKARDAARALAVLPTQSTEGDG